MAIRFLHFVRRYLRCSLVILALVFPGIANAVTYVNPETQGYYKALDGNWYRRDGTGQQYTINTSTKTIHTTSKVHTGVKVLNLPSTIPYSPAKVGTQIVKLARLSTPLSLAAVLAEYIYQNSAGTSDIINCDGQWATQCESNGSSDVLWKLYNSSNHLQSGTYTSETQACAVLGAEPVYGGDPNQYACCYTYGGTSCGQYVGKTTKTTNPCVSPQVFNPNTEQCEDETINVTPPTSAQWEAIEQDPTKTEPTEQQIDEVVKTTEGVPVETPPKVDGLPSTHPVGEPYEKPGGGYEQPVAHLTPGPSGTVGVETEVIPITGPGGIEDPTVTQDPNGETKVITNTPTSGAQDVQVEVSICEDGDTNLACIDVGTPDETPLDNEEFELDFDHAPIAFTSGTCPAGPQFSTPWGNHEFDMYWPCEFATSIKPIILAVGAFAAMAIFVGGLRTS